MGLTRQEYWSGLSFPSRGDLLDPGVEPVSSALQANSLKTELQAPLSMGLSRQEYWSGLSFPSPGDLLDPGTEPVSSALQANSLKTELQGKSN